MMINRRQLVAAGVAGLSATALSPLGAEGQETYPSRPIRLIVPFSAGGVNDVVGRQWADQMHKPLGTVVVENIGGAGGARGAITAARAEPDGHNLFLGSTSTIVLNPMTMPEMNYEPEDFEPAYALCLSMVSVAVHPSVPAKNLQEFIAYAKKQAGKLSYGSAGVGTMSHLGGELFKQLAGIPDMVHVPYKGAGPGLSDLVAGHIPAMSPNVTTNLIGMHNSGRIRILSVHSEKRLTGLPDVPTSSEQGMPSNMIAELFLGIYAAPKTPAKYVQKIADATRQAVSNKAYQEALLKAGFEPILDSGPEHARKYAAQQAKHWAPVVEAAGLLKKKG